KKTGSLCRRPGANPALDVGQGRVLGDPGPSQLVVSLHLGKNVLVRDQVEFLGGVSMSSLCKRATARHDAYRAQLGIDRREVDRVGGRRALALEQGIAALDPALGRLLAKGN